MKLDRVGVLSLALLMALGSSVTAKSHSRFGCKRVSMEVCQSEGKAKRTIAKRANGKRSVTTIVRYVVKYIKAPPQLVVVHDRGEKATLQPAQPVLPVDNSQLALVPAKVPQSPATPRVKLVKTVSIPSATSVVEQMRQNPFGVLRFPDNFMMQILKPKSL